MDLAKRNQGLQKRTIPSISLTVKESRIVKAMTGVAFRDFEKAGMEKSVGGQLVGGEQLAIVEINAALMIAYRMVGLKEENFPDRTLSRLIADYVFRKHGWVTTEGILAAFEYSIEQDRKNRDGSFAIEHYQKIDIPYVNRILNIYRGYAEGIYGEVERKSYWYKTAVKNYKADRAKDDESIKKCLRKTLEQHKAGDHFTYSVMFDSFYDYLDYNGKITLTTEQKKEIHNQVKARNVDRFTDSRAKGERLNADLIFSPKNTLRQSKGQAFIKQLNLTEIDLGFLEVTCYLAEGCFTEIAEIQLQMKKLALNANNK